MKNNLCFSLVCEVAKGKERGNALNDVAMSLKIAPESVDILSLPRMIL